jgi:hypothetical protein
MTSLFRKITRVFLEKQTYLNLAYLGWNITFGFACYITFQVCLLVAWGLMFPNISILASLSLDWIARIKLVLVILSGP